MNIRGANSCPSCGGPVDIPGRAITTTCAYCGVSISIERSDGDVMLTISSAIEESAESVKAAVKESANSQIDEMRRIALENQLATKQSSLQSIQKEIRELDRTNTKGMYKWQIKEWKKQRHGLREQDEC